MEGGSLTGVVADASGGTLRLQTVVAPRVADKAAALSGGSHGATWSAVESARVRMLPRAVFQRLVEQQPAVRDRVLRHLAQEVSDQRFALARTCAPALQRLAAHLEAACGARQSVALPHGQQGLAEQLGLSRVTVNRALQRLAEQGCVSLSRGAVEVRDRAKLAAMAQPE